VIEKQEWDGGGFIFAIWRILALVMGRSQPHPLNPPLLTKERGRRIKEGA
jgi:hypothetical protein